MINKQLIIDDKQIDLGENKIVTSYQLADVQDLTTRKFSHSNRFTIPLTENNIKNLGFANLESSSTDKPYKKSSARLINNGINILPNALATIEGVDNGFSIELYSGAKEFFELLGDKLLEELTPDNDTNDYYTAHDGGFYNAYFAVSGTNEAANPLADVRKLTMKYKSIVERIIASAGYTKSGAVFNETRLGDLALFPLGDKGYYNQAFVTNKELDARHAGGVMTVTNTYQKINFTNVIKNVGGYYDGTNTYTEKKPISTYNNAWYKHSLVASIAIDSQANLTGGAIAISIRIIQNGVVYGPLVASLGFFPRVYLLYTGLLNAGNNQTCYVEIKTDVGTVDLTFNKATKFYNEVSNIDPAIGLYKNFHGLMPTNIKQKDFMKDFAIRYGVLFTESNNVLIAKTLKEIIQDKKNARNWTNKRDYSVKDAIKFEFSNKYAQSNYFKYTNDNDGTYDYTGQGNLTVPNINLEIKKDYYTSFFASSKTRLFGNSAGGFINCAVILTPLTSGLAAGDDAALRLLMIRDDKASEPDLAGGVTSYKVAFFEDSTAAYDCSYDQVVSYSYTEIKNALAKAKLINRKYILNIIDIGMLDLFYLVYDAGNYYLVNKVSNYQADKSTSVQVFKIV